jgi:hypothetical protein
VKDRKPRCSDFVIAVARKIRMKPTNMVTGTAAGTAIRRIFPIVREYYSDKEFLKTLNQLLTDQTIIITAHISTIEKVDEEKSADAKDWHRRTEKNTKLTTIFRTAPFDRGRWFFDRSKRSVQRKDLKPTEEYLAIRSPRLYVVADGLPQKVTALEKHLSSSVATEVLESMRKKKTRTAKVAA